MKKIRLIFFTFVAITLLLVSNTVSANLNEENTSEVQSCTSIYYENAFPFDAGQYYFYSMNLGSNVYRGYLSKNACIGACLYIGRLYPEPCPYPTPFSEPIIDVEEEMMKLTQ